jgi:hypothetical protein
MSAITGFTLSSAPCPDVTPGIVALKMIPRTDIASATEATDEISAFTLEAAVFWKVYELSEIGNAGIESVKVESRTRLWNTTATIDILGHYTAIKTAIEELGLSSCGLVIAAKMTDDSIVIYGYDEENGIIEAMRMTGSTTNTGKEEGDLRMSTITMAGRQTEMPKVFSGNWVTGLALS